MSSDLLEPLPLATKTALTQSAPHSHATRTSSDAARTRMPHNDQPDHRIDTPRIARLPRTNVYLPRNLRCCATDSRWVLYGLLGGAEPNAPSLLAKLLRKRVSLLSTTLRSRSLAYKASLVSQFSASSLSKFVSKDFEVILDSKSFLLDDVQAAHDYMETNANIGKIIVRVDL